MKLCFKYIPKLSPIQNDIIRELEYHTTKLYNIVNYDLHKKEYKKYLENYYLYKSNYHSEYLHSHTYEYCLKVLDENWKSYFASKKDYDKHSEKYNGRPNAPKYKNQDKPNEIIFSNYAIRIEGKKIKLSLSKKMQEKFNVKSLNFVIFDRLQSIINYSKIKQIKIRKVRKEEKYEVIVIYDMRVVSEITEGNTNVMAIDLGLNNLAAIVNEKNTDHILIDGRKLKSKNRYLNEKIRRLESIEMKKVGSKKYKETKRIRKLRKYRENYIRTYLQKATKKVIEYGLKNGCKKIVIGDIRGIKKGMKGNRSFKEIPIEQFAKRIEYKAKIYGMEVVRINESYTSGVSSIDLDEITKENYQKSRRVKRGLYISKEGKKIKADIKGSIHILRKNNKSIPKLVELMKDKGYSRSPIKSLIA